MKFTTREMFCAFNVYKKARAHYTLREVLPEARVFDDCIYYWNRRGEMRVLMWKDDAKSIWRAAEYPNIRKIWPRRK